MRTLLLILGGMWAAAITLIVVLGASDANLRRLARQESSDCSRADPGFAVPSAWVGETMSKEP